MLLIDADPQMHLTAGLGYLEPGFDWTVEDWLAQHAGAPVAIAHEAGLSLVPGSPAQPACPGGLPARSHPWEIIDAPPSCSDLTCAMMRDADLVLAPLEPDFLGLQGINRLLRTMRQNGVGWDRLRLLLTRYNGRLTVHREVRARLAEQFGAQVLAPDPIRISVRLAEAPGQGRSIFGHAPRSTGARDHLALARFLTGQPAPARKRKTG